MPNGISSFGRLFFFLLLVSCSHIRSTSAKTYPDGFVHSSPGVYWGSSIRYTRSVEISHSTAYNRAIQSVTWGRHVRLQGARLFELEVDGQLAFRGENIGLPEVDSISTNDCQIDTMENVSFVWISIDCTDSPVLSSGWVSMQDERPQWLESFPQDKSRIFAVGIAEKAYSDETSSWELAEYRALVELGFTVKVSTGSVGKQTEDHVDGVFDEQIDVVLEGYHPLARWADSRHVYVLASMPLPTSRHTSSENVIDEP